MKLIPTQFERTSLLLGILALMAILFPQSWSTMRFQANGHICLLQMYLFACLIVLTCIVAGAKRQPIVALLSISSLAIAAWFATGNGLVSYGYRTNLIGPTETGWKNSTEAIIWLAVVSCVAFATSFAISFLLDRFAKPLWGVEQSKKEQDSDGTTAEKNKSSRIRFLIVLTVGLFLFQAIGNVAGRNLPGNGSIQAYFLPVGYLLLASFCCGLICRLRLVGAWIVGAFLAIASMGAVATVAVQRGESVASWFMPIAFASCSTLIALVFALLGNSKQKLTRRFSWLTFATVGIAVGLGIIGMKHDLHSLLLGDEPFDLPRAAFLKSLNSDPSVRVAHEVAKRKGSPDELYFSFGSESKNDFFNRFEVSGLFNGSCQINIGGLAQTVDLSQLKKFQPSRLCLSNCELSSQQLADLFQVGIPVQLINCEFVSGKVRSVPISFGASVFQNAKKQGTTKQFIAAIEDFEIDSPLSFWCHHASDGDIQAVLDKLPSIKSKLGKISWSGSPIPASHLSGRPGLENLSVKDCDFQFADGDKPIYPGSFALVLKSKATVGGRVEDSNTFWSLVLGAVGEFTPFLLDLHRTGNSRIDFADQEMLIQMHFGYGLSEESGEIEKLWLPWCDSKIIASVGQLKSLTALSFDIEWLRNGTVSQAFAATLPSNKDVSDLNLLTNLRELYLSFNEQVDLSVLSSLSELETIQFTSSSTGFNRDLFPKLKKARILLDRPLKNGLMKELAATESLETLVIVDFNSTNFDQVQFLAQARPIFSGVDLRVVNIDDGETLIPEHFKQHRLDVRQKCIEKYLE